MRWQIKCLTHISAFGGGSWSDDLILFKPAHHLYGSSSTLLPLLILQLWASLTVPPYLSLPIGKMKSLSRGVLHTPPAHSHDGFPITGVKGQQTGQLTKPSSLPVLVNLFP